MNVYGRIPDLRLAINAQGTTANTSDLLRLLEAASENVRHYTGRIFHTETRTVYLNGNGDTRLWLMRATNEPYRSDLVSVTTLKVDEDGDNTFELTLTADEDYWLYPDNPTVTGKPVRALDIVSGRSTSPDISVWPARKRCIELVGSWGWPEKWDTGEGRSGTLSNTTDTSLVISAVDATDEFFPGDMLLMGTEQLYVTDVEYSTDTTITVERGVNGTTAAAQSDVAISVRRYPEDIEWAVVADAARRFWNAAAGYTIDAGSTPYSHRWPTIRDTLNNYVEGALSL